MTVSCRLTFNPINSLHTENATFSTAPLSALHVDVSSTIDGAREIGPVILVDANQVPQGIVLAFPGEEGKMPRMGGALVRLARLLADAAAGRVALPAELTARVSKAR